MRQCDRNGHPAPFPVTVWVCRREAVLGAHGAAAPGHLSADEAERAARLHFERDRLRWLASRLALRALLGAHLGVAPAELRFTLGPCGKPALLGEPRVSFNLSHAGELTVLAVSDGVAVGVDVEEVVPDRATLALAETVFSQAELAALVALPAPSRTAAFYRCWTRKEAVIKARGLGFSADLRAFDVSLGEDEAPRVSATRPDAAEAARWTLAALPVGEGYEAALAVATGATALTVPVALTVHGGERTLVDARGEHLRASW